MRLRQRTGAAGGRLFTLAEKCDHMLASGQFDSFVTVDGTIEYGEDQAAAADSRRDECGEHEVPDDCDGQHLCISQPTLQVSACDEMLAFSVCGEGNA